MTDKHTERADHEPENSYDPEIFGRHRTKEEILRERKAQRAAARKQQAEERRARREAARASGVRRKDLPVMIGVLAAMVILAGAVLSVQIIRDTKAERFERDEESPSYFTDTDAQPELSAEGLTAAVNELYYTKGGYLCVRMTMGNGLDKPQRMTALEVEIRNGDTDALIGSGYTKNISKNYTVEAGGYNGYTFYISPEHLKITDDSLSTIAYSITATGEIMDAE